MQLLKMMKGIEMPKEIIFNFKVMQHFLAENNLLL